MTTVKRILVVPVGGALLFAMACGGGGGGSHSNTITTSGGNVQAIVVNSGPDGNYANGAFSSAAMDFRDRSL